MEVFTDLTPGEFIVAQLRSIHALRGTYYREIPIMRTITAVALLTATQATVTLSDGALCEVGGYPSIGGTPDAPNYGVALRDPSSPTGAFLGETPPLTYEIALEFQKLGINDKEVLKTIAKGPTPVVAVPVGATPETPAQPKPPVVIDGAEHAEIAEHVASLRQRIGTEFHHILDRIESLLHIGRL